MRELNVPFRLERHPEEIWIKPILRAPVPGCTSLENPNRRCAFRIANQCVCERYNILGGSCNSMNREDGHNVIFVVTDRPESPKPTIKARCKKAPNEYTTEGKEYNLEKLEPSGYHRYKDDLGEYSYITEEVSTFFDI